MKSFAYLEPATLPEAIQALAEHRGGGWHVLAGGTDVVVMMQQGKLSLEGLVNIGRVRELTELRVDPGGVTRIGSMVRIRDLERSETLTTAYPIIADALRWFGGVTIRHFMSIMLIGMVTGTYSSLFFAVPLLVVWEQNEWSRVFRPRQVQAA